MEVSGVGQTTLQGLTNRQIENPDKGLNYFFLFENDFGKTQYASNEFSHS